MRTKDLREMRARLHEEAKAILDKAVREKRETTAEENAKVDKLYAEVDLLKARIDTAERAERGDAIEAELRQSQGRLTESFISDGRPGGDLALRAWLAGPRHATPAMIEAAEAAGVRWQAAEFEARALSIGTTTAGGNAVGNEMIRAYHEVQKWYGRVENYATVVNTDTGATLPWPTMDDTSNTGRILAEATGATTTTDPTFGVVNLSSFKFSSDAVIVSLELLQDSSVNISQYLGAALGTRVGRIKNTYFTTGSGTGQPKGIVTASALGKTCSATNAFTLDEVIDLVHAVDVAYRSAPACGFMMSDTVAAYCRKFKDSQNQYLWSMSVQQGQPDRLFGYPVIINNDMSAAFTTAQKLILFGDLNKYVVRNAGAVLLRRSDDLRFLESQVVFHAIQRSDGNLPDTTAVRHLKLA